MKWLYLAGRYVSGHNDEIIYGMPTFENCIVKCEEWGNGPCRSFEWVRSDLRCQLSSQDQHSMGLQISSSRNDVLYGENCEGKKFVLALI